MREKIIEKLNGRKPLLESIMSLSVLNALNVILPLATLPYLLRIIGSDKFGVYSFVYVIIQYLLLITNYGFNYSATKSVAINRNDIEYLSKLFSNVLIVRFILFILSLVLILILSPFLFNENDKLLMFIFGLGIVVGDILNPIWLFQGMEKMRYITIVNFISRMIFTVLIFILIRNTSDYIYILLIQSLGYFVGGVISLYIAFKQFKIYFLFTKYEEIISSFKKGFSLFASTIGTNLYTNANVFILSFFVSNHLLGIYSAAEKVIKGLQSLTSPITQALFPHIGYSLKSVNLKEKLNVIRKLSIYSIVLLIVPTLLIVIFSDTIVQIVAGKEFFESVYLVKLMSPLILIGTLNFILGVVGLINLNFQNTFFVAVMISGIVSVLFVLLGAKYLGIYAGALSILISEILLLFICLNKYRLINKQESV